MFISPMTPPFLTQDKVDRGWFPRDFPFKPFSDCIDGSNMHEDAMWENNLKHLLNTSKGKFCLFRKCQWKLLRGLTRLYHGELHTDFEDIIVLRLGLHEIFILLYFNLLFSSLMVISKHQLVGLREHYRKLPYFMGKSMVSCRLSCKSTHWQQCVLTLLQGVQDD